MADKQRSSFGSITDILGSLVKKGLESRTRSGGGGQTRSRRSSGGARSRGRIPKISLPKVRGGSRRRGAASGGAATKLPRPSTSRRPAAPRQDPRRGELPNRKAQVVLAYEPRIDGDADPGEIVWAYVPYEDDPNQGKDRPLLVVGHVDADVAALQLTSKRKDDRHHHALGSGPWDRQGRPSWVKLDRLLRLDPDGIRREGATLDEGRFSGVVEAFRSYDR